MKRTGTSSLIFLLIAATSACTGVMMQVGGESEPVEGTHLEVSIRAVEWPWGGVDGEVDLPLEIEIANLTDENVEIERIEIRSRGDISPVRLIRTSRPFSTTIESGSSAALEYWARARALEGGATRAPILTRVTIDYLVGGTIEADETFELILGDRFSARQISDQARF